MTPSYALMQPHQQRVVDEKTELDDKRIRLETFIDENTVFANLPEEEQSRMRRQARVMKDYSEVLTERIVAFGD